MFLRSFVNMTPWLSLVVIAASVTCKESRLKLERNFENFLRSSYEQNYDQSSLAAMEWLKTW